MSQTVINIFVAGLGALVGFLLNRVWQAVRDLQIADKDLVQKINDIEVLVAGDYVKQDKFDAMIDRLFAKLNVIEQKLDKKADR